MTVVPGHYGRILRGMADASHHGKRLKVSFDPDEMCFMRQMHLMASTWPSDVQEEEEVSILTARAFTL